VSGVWGDRPLTTHCGHSRKPYIDSVGLFGIIGDLLGQLGLHIERRQDRGAAMTFALISFLAAVALIFVVWFLRG
jgi:hypothetical protein